MKPLHRGFGSFRNDPRKDYATEPYFQFESQGMGHVDSRNWQGSDDMQVSVDISLYPLHQDYIPQIDAFILLLNQEPAVQVVTNVLSTQPYG